MPLDVLGGTRVTMSVPTSCSSWLARTEPSPSVVRYRFKRSRESSITSVTGIADWKSILNEEFLVGASHQLAPITSLPFVHTARRSYRWDDKAKLMDWPCELLAASLGWEVS